MLGGGLLAHTLQAFEPSRRSRASVDRTSIHGHLYVISLLESASSRTDTVRGPPRIARSRCIPRSSRSLRESSSASRNIGIEAHAGVGPRWRGNDDDERIGC